MWLRGLRAVVQSCRARQDGLGQVIDLEGSVGGVEHCGFGSPGLRVVAARSAHSGHDRLPLCAVGRVLIEGIRNQS
jgi:hypothetical protein